MFTLDEDDTPELVFGSSGPVGSLVYIQTPTEFLRIFGTSIDLSQSSDDMDEEA
jgi:hypothetical protein